MKVFDFNRGWKWRRAEDAAWSDVTLPHDAMIGEKRTAESDGGTNTGWFEGHDYVYEKTFFVPSDFADKVVTLEFEGVYRNAEVYINGEKAMSRPYGYIGFFVPVSRFLRCGEENTVRVTARNADQPNSRWYSGAGIYRPVTMFVQERRHILLNGVRIRTLTIDPAVVEVRVRTSEPGEVRLSVEREGVSAASVTAESDGEAVFAVEVPHAALWSPEEPNLYTCTARFGGDEVTETFGIRTVSCDAENGFCINGARVILRGACIHHDNGILGARCFEEAEERKIRLLKETGYNAVRSAHNPCSKAMLRACDRLGVLMMDEYVDMWYIHKTMYDYADYVPAWYERDITDMIEKDFNHPSVVMYSLGNEVAETGQAKGIEFFRKMRAVCKKLDPDRPVTAGVNIFFNYLHALGFGVYTDKKARENPQKKVGSEFFNDLAGRLGANFMKIMAKLPGCDRKTRGCYAAMDVAGYNYGILRYEGDLKKYPGRVILGSETFCSDACRFMEIAKKHPALIGDFVWAGMDYLGEVGVGAWEYKEYAPDFRHGPGWISAGSGRLDLLGNPLGEAAYTRVAFGLTDVPQIAVVPVGNTDEKHSPSAWKFSNARPSWSWNGLDGKKARVEVYSRAPAVELYINGKRVGRKKRGKNCCFVFRTTYRGGEVTAVALDENGKELSRNSLRTAGEETVLSVAPERETTEGGGLCFVRLRYTDAAGTVKPLERGVLKVSVAGGELLALGCACPYNERGYMTDETDTYYGEAMAVVRASADASAVIVTATDGRLRGETEIKVRGNKQGYECI